MACGEGAAIIGCVPRQALEFVLDVGRYRLADREIGWPVTHPRRSEGWGRRANRKRRSC